MHLSTKDKFTYQLTSRNTPVINSLAKFVHSAFKIRSSCFIDLQLSYPGFKLLLFKLNHTTSRKETVTVMQCRW